jgi:hypothetical protein
VLVVVIAGAAGMVIVTDAVLPVFATDVAVMVIVWLEEVAAGAVKVADAVDVFERLPPPLTLQVTPWELLSLVTVAVRVTVSAPSTVVADAVTETLGLAPPPAQPVIAENVTRRKKRPKRRFPTMILPA